MAQRDGAQSIHSALAKGVTDGVVLCVWEQWRIGGRGGGGAKIGEERRRIRDDKNNAR